MTTMEVIRKQITTMQSDIHEIEVNVAVLAQVTHSLDNTSKDLTGNVKQLEETIAELAGAFKLIRWLMSLCGIIIAAAAAWIAWLKKSP